MDSAGSKSSMRKEAEEESGKRSEVAGVRSKVPRTEMDLGETFVSKQSALLLAGMDSMRKEAVEESGKKSEMPYDWMKRPGESEGDYVKRLRLLTQRDADLRRQKDADLRRQKVKAKAKGEEPENSEDSVTEESDQQTWEQERRAVEKEALHRTLEKLKKANAKDEESGKPEDPAIEVEKAGKPEESVTRFLHSEAPVTVKNLPMKKAKAKDEELGNSEDVEKAESSATEFLFAEESDQGADNQEAWRVEVKKIQERMAISKAFLHSQLKLPMKKKAEAKDEESADPSSTDSMTNHDNHLDRGKSTLAKKTADEEAADYAWYRQTWESNCCKNCDYFENSTVLSSMQFTHYTPGIIPYNSVGAAVDTLQIFSMQLKLIDDIAGGFELPLSVYGVVAVRDTVDFCRNILFSCDRTDAQELTQHDPFLHLTGPSRAIVSMDTVYFEIQLKVKGAAVSQDKSLITCSRGYTGGCGPGISTLCFKNVLCALELCSQPVKRTVQATILSVQIVNKMELWPLSFAYGGLIACTPLPRTTMVAADSGVSSNRIVLIESKGRPMPKGDRGYVHLCRQVVSVERGGGLDIVIQAYTKSCDVHAEGSVHFLAQNCHVSQQDCIVGEAKVTITVAWSLVADDMDDLVFEADRGRVVGKPEDSVADVGKAETPVTEAGKPEESVTEFLKAEESDHEASRAKVKKIQESMAIGKAFLSSQLKFPTKKAKAKDEESADPSSTNSIQDNYLDKGKSALAKKTADEEEVDYAWYRQSWESNCCKNCDHFENLTVLSSMLFTHYTPGILTYSTAGAAVDTLQIFSMKLKLTDDNAGGFELPLSVYGVVAVRDTVDSCRNILFSCDRSEAQELTHDDPFLRLIGPSRAIVSMDTVYFEIQLKVKGAAASQDKSLITCARGYTGGCGPGISTLCFKNVLCTLELCSQPVKRSVQATILSVQIVKKMELWPLSFAYGGLIACTPLPRTTMVPADSGVSSNQIVLIESKGRPMPKGDRGYVHLWRQVVSVERGGGLDVVIQAYTKSGDVHAEGSVHFTAQSCHVSQQECIVGEAQVTVAVAWSVVPDDMDDVVFA